MSSISTALFYHIWIPDHANGTWRWLIDEQLKRIVRSGLSAECDVFCAISSPISEEVARFCRTHNWLSVLSEGAEIGDYEGKTLDGLYEGACDYDTLGYIHTKGIRYFHSMCQDKVFSAINSWRHVMEMTIIEHFRECHKALDQSDCCGAFFRSDPWPHFAGNMWWAKSEYIKKLQKPTKALYATDTGSHLSDVDRRRLGFERWIGSGHPASCDLTATVVGDRVSDVSKKNLYIDDVFKSIYFNAP